MGRWFDFVYDALERVGAPASFAFVVGDDDDETRAILDEQGAKEGVSVHVIEVAEERREDIRRWSNDRIAHMVELRNTLLAHVRSEAPDLFWSVDSDILVHPAALAGAIELLETRGWDAVGSKCYMEPQPRRRGAPNYGFFNSAAHGMSRWDQTGAFKVGILMAVKLMTPAAYVVDYAFDTKGEDIGWSRNAMTSGLTLGWDGRQVSKHVFGPERLDAVDERVGW